MRTSFRRALAAASATVVASAALVIASATPASALYSWSACPEATSIRLVTANGGAQRLWLHQPDAGTVYVCFHVGGSDGGVLVFKAGPGGGLVPNVVRDPDPSDCVTQISLRDPVDVDLQWQWTSPVPPFYFCFGVNGTAVGVNVYSTGPVNPDVDLWFDPAGPVCGYVKGSYCYYSYQAF